MQNKIILNLLMYLPPVFLPVRILQTDVLVSVYLSNKLLTKAEI